MVVLTVADLVPIRQACAKKVAVNYTKPQINAAVQAVENWFEANRAGLSGVIDTATAPLVLSGAQKKAIVAYWLNYKFGVEN
mgnify:FL=1